MMTTVPPRTLAALRRICTALPDVREEQAWVGTRWTIRRKNFAHVLRVDRGWPPAYARAAGTDGPATVLTFRSAGLLFETLRTTGAPFFVPVWGTRWRPRVIGMILPARFDRDEVTLLLTESYRLLA